MSVTKKKKKKSSNWVTYTNAPYSHYDAPVCGYFAVAENLPKGYKYPFKNGDTVFVFGDIEHMPGHCVIATKRGKVHLAYHTDNFRKLTIDEV
jgi:hypothetical protein